MTQRAARPWVAIIGAGPAGLAAAEVIGAAGVKAVIYDAKPSPGRKFLMAGKSGLNLTKSEPIDALLSAYPHMYPALRAAILAFDNDAIQVWAEGLGQELFTGSTGRVFPKAMKASRLLRAWLARINEQGTELNMRWAWQGISEDKLRFDTPHGIQEVTPSATIFAMGGASWARLGSTGAWAEPFSKLGVEMAAFAPSNAALHLNWSAHMEPHIGEAIKAVAWVSGAYHSRGEAVISTNGLEGGGIYSITPGIREDADVFVDLIADRTLKEVTELLKSAPAKSSFTNLLRKRLKLSPVKIALANEWGRPWPRNPAQIAQKLKALPLPDHRLAPMDEAISTSGGVSFQALTDRFMLKAKPGFFCAGEMIDWDAPTGGYLLTAVLATGRAAGKAALDFLR